MALSRFLFLGAGASAGSAPTARLGAWDESALARGWFTTAPEGLFTVELMPAPAVSGPQTLTQTARFNNTNAFYGGKVNFRLAQTARFDNAQSFFGGKVNFRLVQSARFDNAQSFFGGKVNFRLAQTARFDNSNAFYAGTLVQSGGAQTLTQTTRFDNAQTFYAGKVTLRLVQSARFDNAQTFYAGKVTLRLVQSARFDNANTFYPGKVNQRAVQTARFDNSNTFYPGVLAQSGGPRTLVQSARFDNSNTFYLGTVILTGTPTITRGGGESVWKPRRERPLAPRKSIPWDDVYVDEVVVERAEAVAEAVRQADPQEAASWSSEITFEVAALTEALRLAVAVNARARIEAALEEMRALRAAKARELRAIKARLRQQREDDETVLRLFAELMSRPVGILETADD